MLPAGSSETGCKPTGGVPIARSDRSGGGHELAQHNRHLGGAAAGALKANFAACQPRSPGENDPAVPWLLKRVASLCPLAVERQIQPDPAVVVFDHFQTDVDNASRDSSGLHMLCSVASWLPRSCAPIV